MVLAIELTHGKHPMVEKHTMYTVWKIWLHSSSAVSGVLSSLYLAMRFTSAMTCSLPALHASMTIRHIENTITAV